MGFYSLGYGRLNEQLGNIRNLTVKNARLENALIDV